MAASRDNENNFLPSTPSSSRSSSPSHSRVSLNSPFSLSGFFFDNKTPSPNLFSPPHHEESRQSNEASQNEGHPPHATAAAEPSSSKPITIPIRKKKNEEKSATTDQHPNILHLIQEYTALMMTKGKMDSRRFNKLALALLDKCVIALQSKEGNSAAQQSLDEPTFSKYREDAKEAFGEFRLLLLNAKEMHSETLVQRVVSFIDKGLPPLLTADERKEELQKKSLAFITELSPSMSIKIAPIIKSYISRQFGADLEDLLAEVRLPEMSPKEKTLLYARMFGNFMDDPKCVSFAATNQQLLGDLEPVDVWFLTFFAFVTVRRSRGDNLLMLGLVGRSSVGKSLLFESIVLATGHQLVSSTSSSSGDAGVGRFHTGSKNTVVFHDVNIATMVGVDVERIKSLARSETTVVKIHSSTTTVSPLFVFYTSNERLFKHVVPAAFSAKGYQMNYPSQVETAGKKRVSEENLEAVKARFLEMFVFKAPLQSKQDLESAGTFSRNHFILGTFDRALCLLEKYPVKAFHSLHLPAYVLSGLNKNATMMESVMCDQGCQSHHRQRLEQLQIKFNL